ncbi:hypothetical protein [Saccharopolyspora sp. NPDC049426]
MLRLVAPISFLEPDTACGTPEELPRRANRSDETMHALRTPFAVSTTGDQ